VIDISTIMNDLSLVTFVGEEIEFQEERETVGLVELLRVMG
jgi:hypothetical protein